jgi:hypothetical protein
MASYLAVEPKFSTSLRADWIESSPYFWWWRFLGLSDPYLATCDSKGRGPLADLYNDFGDVRVTQGLSIYSSFKKWWGAKGERYGRLFQERSLFSDAIALETVNDWDPAMGQYPHAVIVVDIHLGVKKAQKMLGDALKDLRHFRALGQRGANEMITDNELQTEDTSQDRYGKPEGRQSVVKRYSTAQYRLSAIVEKKEFAKTFDLIRLIKEHRIEQVDATNAAVLVKIAESANLVRPMRNSNGILKVEKNRHIEKCKKRIEYYKSQAEDYIHWVQLGQFPGPRPPVFDEWDRHTSALLSLTGRPFYYMK